FYSKFNLQNSKFHNPPPSFQDFNYQRNNPQNRRSFLLFYIYRYDLLIFSYAHLLMKNNTPIRQLAINNFFLLTTDNFFQTKRNKQKQKKYKEKIYNQSNNNNINLKPKLYNKKASAVNPRARLREPKTEKL